MPDLQPLVLNRLVLILRPQQVFLDWLKEVAPEPAELSLQAINQDRNVWLIPDFEEPDQAYAWVLKHWRTLFERELGDWITDPDLWPQPLSRERFLAFFDIEMHSIVQDVADQPLELESWEEEEE